MNVPPPLGSRTPDSSMRIQGEMFHRLPIARKLLIIVGVFVAIVICVFYLGVLRSDILSAVRAYVGGEGLWSTGENRGTPRLTDSAASHTQSDHPPNHAEIAAPTRDTKARHQRQGCPPDTALVRPGP